MSLRRIHTSMNDHEHEYKLYEMNELEIHRCSHPLTCNIFKLFWQKFLVANRCCWRPLVSCCLRLFEAGSSQERPQITWMLTQTPTVSALCKLRLNPVCKCWSLIARLSNDRGAYIFAGYPIYYKQAPKGRDTSGPGVYAWADIWQPVFKAWKAEILAKKPRFGARLKDFQ